jgi:hypothetical protein
MFIGPLSMLYHLKKVREGDKIYLSLWLLSNKSMDEAPQTITMTMKIAHHIPVCRRMNWFQDAFTNNGKAKVGSTILPLASPSPIMKKKKAYLLHP